MFKRSTIEQILNPSVLLRVGLGLVFVHAGVLAVMDTETFVRFVPVWLAQVLLADTFVVTHGILSLALGTVFLVGAWTPAAALVAALDFAGILLGYGIDEVTFVLFGLMFASLALLVLSLKDSGHEINRETRV